MAAKRKRTGRPLNAKDYLEQLRGLKGVDDDSFAVASDPIAALAPVSEFLPTGVFALDRLIGGGWPVGRIVEVAAWEQVGKTTLLTQAIANHQRNGAVCVLIDSESAQDPGYMRALGVDTDALIVAAAAEGRVMTVEDVFVQIDRILAVQEAQVSKGVAVPPMVIIWDSLGGTPSKAELEGDAGDKHVASAAKIIKLNFRRLTQRLPGARGTLVFANQFYENIATGGYGGGKKSYGGSGVRYHTSLRIWLSRIKALRLGDAPAGHVVQAELKKTRIVKPAPPAQMGLLYGYGIHNAWTLYQWGQRHGTDPTTHPHWIRTAGAWSYLHLPDGTHQTFQRSYVGLAELLAENPEIYRQVAESYLGSDD